MSNYVGQYPVAASLVAGTPPSGMESIMGAFAQFPGQGTALSEIAGEWLLGQVAGNVGVGNVSLTQAAVSGVGGVIPAPIGSAGTVSLSPATVSGIAVQGNTGTGFPNGSTGTFTVPALPFTWCGWANLPVSPADGTTIALETSIYGTAFVITYSAAFGQWIMQYDGTSFKLRICGSDSGYVFFGVVMTTVGGTFYWRRQGMRSMARVPFTWTRVSIGSPTLIGYGGSWQYVGVWSGSLTEAQILAQSHSPTALIAAYSFCPLFSNTGTDTSGNGHPITLTGTTTTSDIAPAVPEAPAAPTISTEFGRIAQDAVVISPSVVTVSSTFTVGAYIRFVSFPIDLNVNYWLSIYDDLTNEWIGIVDQYTVSTNGLWTGIGGYHGGVNFTYAAATQVVSLIDINDWYAFYVTFTPSGGNTLVSTYMARQGGSITLQASGTLPFLLGSTRKIGVSTNQSHMYVTHLKQFVGALTVPQMQTSIQSGLPDATAYSHHIFGDTGVLDSSGNGIVAYATGDLQQGIAGPALNYGAVTSAGSVSLNPFTVSGNGGVAITGVGSVFLNPVTVAAVGLENTPASSSALAAKCLGRFVR